MTTRSAVLALALSLLVGGGARAASPRGLSLAGARGLYVPDEILVQFREGVSSRARFAAVAARGHELAATLSWPSWARVKVQPGQSVEAAVGSYRGDPAVALAQPNFLYRATAIPDDPGYAQQWGLKNTGQTITADNTQPPGSALAYTTDNPGTPADDLNVEHAWDHITDCSATVVAVVDSGVNYGHQDLAANMWNGGASFPNHGYNYVDGNADPMDFNGHGTHVAGTIGAVGNNALGVVGVCWKAQIMAVRVLDATGVGSSAQILQGIDFAVQHGAKVINMSLGGNGAFDQAYSDAITAAQAADVLVVVAAGNDGVDNDSGTAPIYPCNFTQQNLLCVAALDQSYQLASFSNWGAISVDVGAPGTNVLSTWAGTSGQITDPLNTGWTGSTTTAGGWTYGTPGGTACLVDPSSYPDGQYAQNTDDRAYKVFDVSGASAVVAEIAFAVDVANGDYFRGACNGAGGDPFAGGTTLGAITNMATYPKLQTANIDVTSCASAAASFGFQLQSGASSARGVALCGLTFKGLVTNATSYNTIAGTSMATPATAGVATLLRAYNPSYTYSDTVTAIMLAGRPVPALSGKTTTGNAVDAMLSLAYIHTPTGVTASVQ